MKSHAKKILTALLVAATLPTASPAEQAAPPVFTSAGEIKKAIDRNNYDLKLLRQNIKAASAIVSGVRGGFYPMLNAQAGYTDDRKEPTNNFVPARTENSRWSASLNQHTPAGIDLSIGMTNDRTKLYQSDPPNNFLPYPATYHQPAAYLQVKMDLLQDLFGYVTMKEWDKAKLDEETAQLKEEAIKRKLFMNASSLFWNIRALYEVEALTDEMIGDLTRLSGDVKKKVDRGIAEPGDYYKLKSLIAQRQAGKASIRRNITDMEKALSELMGFSGAAMVKPSSPLSSMEPTVRNCEAFIAGQPEVAPSWSAEFELLRKEARKGELDREIRYRDALPDVELTGSYTLTGTAGSSGEAYNELTSGKRPRTSVGLSVSYPLSGSLRESSRKLGEVAMDTAHFRYNQRLSEGGIFLDSLKRKTAHIGREGELYASAVDYAGRQLKDLYRRFEQGRVSLFQLVQEQSEILSTRIREKQLWAERISNIFLFKSRFDRLSCGAATAGAGEQ